MNISLIKPLIFFDLETTGIDIRNDRIVSISAHKFFPDGSCEMKKYLINPTIPIPLRSTEVHGITDEMVKDSPTFRQMAVNMHMWYGDSDLSGFNIMDFDIPLLGVEFYRCGIEWKHGFVADVFKMEQQVFNRHNLMSTYKRYMNCEFDGAHDSEADNAATQEIFNKMMEVHSSSIPSDIEGIHNMLFTDRKDFADFAKVFYWVDGRLYWNINPKKDQPVDKSDQKFADWFMSKDFSKQSKDILLKYVSS